MDFSLSGNVYKGLLSCQSSPAVQYGCDRRGCVCVGVGIESRTEGITHQIPLNEELREVDDRIMFGVGALL